MFMQCIIKKTNKHAIKNIFWKKIEINKKSLEIEAL